MFTFFNIYRYQFLDELVWCSIHNVFVCIQVKYVCASVGTINELLCLKLIKDFFCFLRFANTCTSVVAPKHWSMALSQMQGGTLIDQNIQKQCHLSITCLSLKCLWNSLK